MSGPSDDERLAKIHEQVFDAVLEKGHMVHFVEADAASVIHQNRPYAYTVGRALMSRPEFLVTGLGAEESTALLSGLVTWDDVVGKRETLPGSFVDLGTIKVKLMRADIHPLLGAIAAFGADTVTAVQALWPRRGGYPDVNDRWPDQPIHPYGETAINRGDPYAT